MRWELLLSSLYRYRNESTDRLSNLPKVTKPITGGEEIKPRVWGALRREDITLPALSLSIKKLSPSAPEAHHSPVSSNRPRAGKHFCTGRESYDILFWGHLVYAATTIVWDQPQTICKWISVAVSLEHCSHSLKLEFHIIFICQKNVLFSTVQKCRYLS